MLPRFRSARRIGAREVAALAVLALPMALADLAAAQPSPEQIETIRQACRSDFIEHCSSMQPGGREALQCLERNAAQLSTECGSAISAAVPKAGPESETAAETKPETPPPATAVAQPSPRDQLTAVQEVCTIKDASHCSWIAPGSPELLLCLRANTGELSPACQNAVRATRAAATPSAVAAPPVPAPRAAAATTQAPPPAPAAPTAAAVPKPSPTQISAIRAACRSGFMAYCTGIQRGGPDAMECLERNKAGVSPACQTALAAIGGGGAVSPDATAPAAAPLPAPAPTDPFLTPRLRLRTELGILRACAGDRRIRCGDVPPGGGRIIACLARNPSKLMPGCRSALAAVRG
jgi:Cysteine rich repeat